MDEKFCWNILAWNAFLTKKYCSKTHIVSSSLCFHGYDKHILEHIFSKVCVMCILGRMTNVVPVQTLWWWHTCTQIGITMIGQLLVKVLLRHCALYTYCHRPVFSLGVSQHMHKITNLWTFLLNWSSKMQDNNEGKKHACGTTLFASGCLIKGFWPEVF